MLRRRSVRLAGLLTGLLALLAGLLVSQAASSSAAVAKPVVNGPVFNDPLGDSAQQSAIFTQLINAGHGPTIRDGVDAATRPGTTSFPYLAPPNPNPPEPPEHH